MKMYKTIDSELFDECFDRKNLYFLKIQEIIEDAKERGVSKESGYEIHHIIPRSFYPKKKMQVDNSSDNLIKLYPREHYLIHYYYWICAKPIIKKSMAFALHLMTQTATKRKCDVSAEELAVMYDEVKSDLVLVFKTNGEKSFRSISKEKRAVMHKKGMETRRRNKEYCEYLSQRMKGNKLGEGRLKHSLLEINLITRLHNLGFSKRELESRFDGCYEGFRKQVDNAVKKYGADKVEKWETLPQINRNEKFVIDTRTDDILSFSEAQKREGVTKVTFLKKLKKEDCVYKLTKPIWITDVVHTFYTYYKKDPSCIDRLKEVLDDMIKYSNDTVKGDNEE